MSKDVVELSQPETIASLPDKTAMIRAARLLGDTWSLLIVRELLEGTKRFGEIQDGLERVTPQTLSARLKSMEHCGLITRQAYPEIPPRVEYALTEKGQAVHGIIQALAEFGENYMAQEPPTERDCDKSACISA